MSQWQRLGQAEMERNLGEEVGRRGCLNCLLFFKLTFNGYAFQHRVWSHQIKIVGKSSTLGMLETFNVEKDAQGEIVTRCVGIGRKREQSG